MPVSKKYLLQPELLVGEKLIRIDLWIGGDGIPCISYRPGEKADNPLPHIHPNYGAGDGYCPRCMVSWERPIGDKCLYCGTKLRRRSRKINNSEKKYINPEIEDLE
ncbi:hypothetical protein HRbin02_01798 [Candidatus Calditenuaceae archaeon HR02]|nr:hypothetical protein HRbin02_01798 [Candidatus Calditenuaceae archaeon HR02]